MFSADGKLMPSKKNQAPPGFELFQATKQVNGASSASVCDMI